MSLKLSSSFLSSQLQYLSNPFLWNNKVPPLCSLVLIYKRAKRRWLIILFPYFSGQRMYNGTHFLLTLETIVFPIHLLSTTSKPFSSLSTRLAHAARLGVLFFTKTRYINYSWVYCIQTVSINSLLLLLLHNIDKNTLHDNRFSLLPELSALSTLSCMYVCMFFNNIA